MHYLIENGPVETCQSIDGFATQLFDQNYFPIRCLAIRFRIAVIVRTAAASCVLRPH
jgi:hypothetical protein